MDVTSSERIVVEAIESVVNLSLESEGSLWTLPIRVGCELPMSKKAGDALYFLCVRLLSESELDGRVDRTKLFRRFRSELMLEFPCDSPSGTRVTDEGIKSAFRAALAPAEAALADRQHFFPCTLVTSKQPSEFIVGPVKFHRREAIWPTLLQKIEARESSGDNAKIRQIFRKDIEEHFTAFNWVAEVVVQQCESEVSVLRAEKMADAAVCFLQALIGGHRVGRLSVGGQAAGRNIRASLTLKENKYESANVSYRSVGLGLGDGVWERAILVEHVDTLDLMGVALSGAFQLPSPCPLAARIVEAVTLYGAGAATTVPGVRLIALLMAVERLLLPTGADAVTSTVQKRSATYSNWEGDHNSKIEKLYTSRGELVHGQCSLNANSHAKAVVNADDLFGEVLLGLLYGLADRLEDQSFSDVDLASYLDKKYDEFNEQKKKRGREKKPDK